MGTLSHAGLNISGCHIIPSPKCHQWLSLKWVHKVIRSELLSSLLRGIKGRLKAPFFFSSFDLFIQPKRRKQNEGTANCWTACHPITKAPSGLWSSPSFQVPLILSSSNPCKSKATGRIKHVVYEHVEIASCHRHQSFMHGEDLCPFPVLLPLHAFYFFLFYVSILLIIHKCPLSLPFPFPPSPPL